MPKLVLIAPDDAQRSFRLEQGRRRVVGSSARCSIRLAPLAADPEHCEIRYAGGLWMIRDLESTTGTLVNGEPITEECLTDGDSVQVGEARFSFVAASPSGSPGASRRRAKTKTRGASAKPLRRPRAAARRSTASRGPSPSPAVIASAVVAVVVVIAGLAVMLAGGSDEERASSTEGQTLAKAPTVRAPTERNAVLTPPLESGDPPSTDRSRLSSEAKEIERQPAESSGRDGPVAPKSPASRNPQPETRGDDPASTRLDGPQTESLLLELSVLDFEAAAGVLSDAGTKLEKKLASELATQINELESTWSAIEQALPTAVRKRSSFHISTETTLNSAAPESVLHVKLKAPQRVRFLAVTGSVVELGDSGGRHLGSLRVLSLPDKVLLRILESTFPGNTVDLRPRLARLLAVTEGPERALRMSQVPDAGAGDDAAWKDSSLFSAASKRWPFPKVAALKRKRARFEKGGSARDTQWAALCANILSTLDSTAGAAAGDPSARPLLEDWAHARERCLPLRSLFGAASVVNLGDGRVRLVYDFSKKRQVEAQVADFHAVGDATRALTVRKGALVTRGEYRLLAGEPFLETLTIRGQATALAKDSPNVNVALWTAETDSITCTDGEKTNWFSWLRKDPGTPSDYFVFGMGYRAVVCSTLGRMIEQVTIASTKETVDLPALVLLAGSRGSTLHRDLGEGLFAKPAALGKSGRVRFEIDWIRNNVTWTVNQRDVGVGAADHRARFRAAAKRSGSLSIITNGSPVVFHQLEIDGRLSPDWVAGQTARRVAAELRTLSASRPGD